MKIRGSNIDGECRFGCGKIEDMHHVFVECRRFKDMRKETVDGILKATADIIFKVLTEGGNGRMPPYKS